MIETFEGRIGGGKTLSAVQRCLQVWVAGGFVATNIEINWAGCKTYCLAKYGVMLDDRQLLLLTDEQIAEFWKHTPSGTRERPVLVIIDEADVWIGNQTTGVKVSPEFMRFLKQSRKMSTDIIFITQALKNLHSQVSRLNQHVWRFRDMEKWRIKSFGIQWPFPQILQVQYDYDGKTEMARRYWTKDVGVFGCYETNALHGGAFERLEALDMKAIAVTRVTKQRFEIPDWWLYAAAVVAIAALVVL